MLHPGGHRRDFPAAGRQDSRRDEPERRLRPASAGLPRRECVNKSREDHSELHGHREPDGMEKVMNILVYSVAADSGGALSILMDFYKKFRENKANHYYFVISTPYLEECDNVTVLRFPQIKKGWGHRFLFEYLRAPRLIRKYHIDEVFSLTNTVIPFTDVKQILYLQQCLPFIEYHFSWKKSKMLWIYQNIIGYMIKRSVRRAHQIIVQTKWMKESVSQVVGKSMNTICVKRPDINLEEVNRFSGFRESTIFFYPAGPFLYKNHMLILRACRRLQEENILCYRIYFTLAGMENAYAIMLKNYVQKYKLPVEFIGTLKREEVFKMYSQSVLLFPSYVETLGMPLIEARAAGCPILATDASFSREVLSGYKEADLFDKDDWKSLYQKMRLIIMRQEAVRKDE